jgi:hypothetical protein
MAQVKSYNLTTGTEFVSEKISSLNHSLWNIFSFPNRLKVFLFKFYNNLLGTGNRVFHFNPAAEVSCVFCVKSLNLPAPIETFSHIFYDCPNVFNIVNMFTSKFLNIVIDRNNFFNGFYTEDYEKNYGVTIILNCLRYCIWQARLLKTNISYYTIENETSLLLQTITDSNLKIKHSILFNDLINIGGHADQHQEQQPRQDGQQVRRHP